MENVNPTASTTHTTTRRQQQQQQKLQQQQILHPHDQQQEQQQQQHYEHQQQFCLRWHNHQTSLLSTLPILLDQSHLTDVTLSAEGRTLRAHRVVLSACSTFFLELFRALDTANHPVIILPGAPFTAIAALLTFMYSGEVNVYEEQIPVLLNLAETLGVKGLADVQHNKSTAKRRASDAAYEQHCKDEMSEGALQAPAADTTPNATPTPPPPPPPPPQAQLPPPTTPNAAFNVPPAATAAALNAYSFANPLLAAKFPSQLENFFLKSLQFYPHLFPQPLNFSQTALNKTTELLAKYQQQCSLYQGALSTLAQSAEENLAAQQPRLPTPPSPTGKLLLLPEDAASVKRFCASADKLQSFMQQQPPPPLPPQQKDVKRIDKIVDSLRCSSRQSNSNSEAEQPHQPSAAKALQVPSLPSLTNINCSSFESPTRIKSPSLFSFNAHAGAYRKQSPQQLAAATAFEAALEEQTTRSLQQQFEQLAGCSHHQMACSNGAKDALDAPSGGVGGNMSQQQAKSPSSTLGAVADKFQQHAATKSPSSLLALPTGAGASAAQGKTNSKLYATCFICHKQLSNQYNLRVHLETHQNVRYACNVCSHISRSKDALRKHVSYRHPGAPSPCETEARRKRASKVLLGSGGVETTSPTSTAAVIDSSENANNNNNNSSSNKANNDSSSSGDAQMAAAAAYMFLPNQYHLAAAAAAAQQQQQLQQQQQQQQQQGSLVNLNENLTALENASASPKVEPRSSPEAADSEASTTTTTTNTDSLKDANLNLTNSF